jgi:hypothetical protein
MRGEAWWRLLLIPLAALFVVHPLMVHGCSCGHDFDFHLVSWFEVATQIAHGNLHPHWAFTPAFNAGEPRFVFYPPISWYLGAGLGLVLTHLPGVNEAAGWSASPVVFTWIALTLAGLTMYRLAREFASEGASLVGAVLYVANPYMLFTAYERTAYGELLAAAWIPLLLLAVLRERVTVVGVAAPVGLLWLTNVPAAIMGTYMLGFLAMQRLASIGARASRIHHDHMIWAANPSFGKRDQPPGYRPLSFTAVRFGRPDRSVTQRAFVLLKIVSDAFKILAGTALGLALAAFYLIPAAYERRFVQMSMAMIAGMRIDQNFLFEHTGATPDQVLHDAVLHAASVIAVLLLVATVIALGAVAARRIRNAFPILPLASLSAVIAFLLTPRSAFLWNHALEAALLQFPWRLLAVLGPVLALGIARLLSGDRPGDLSGAERLAGRDTLARRIVVVVVLAALTIPAYHAFRQPCDPEDTAPARLALFHSSAGTDPTDEYTPVDADNDALTAGDPPYWLADSADAGAPVGSTPGPVPTHFDLTAPRAEDLILNLRQYPAWRISRDGVFVAPSEYGDRADGLIAIPVPAGSSRIDIRYAQTLDQTLGDAVSLVALALFVFLLRRRRPTLP